MPEFPRIIEPEELTKETLLQVFSLAGFNASITGEDIWIREDDALAVKLFIEPTNKLLCFESSSGLNDLSSLMEKMAIANELNSANLVRFQILYESVMVAEYHLYYGDGLLTMQLLRTCKLFQFMVINLLRSKYEAGGVFDVSQ